MPSRWMENLSGGELDVASASGTGTYRVPALIQRLLRNRGFHNPSEWENLFEPKLGQLTNPLALKGMKESVDRLIEAYRRQEKICLYADFDMDGTPGLALALEGFRRLGYENVQGLQPRRLTEGYGLHDFLVEDLHRQGVSLIVTIDVGITAAPACAKARSLGVDVIITDHHQPDADRPDAVAIVNPNQGNCSSGLGYLCGAGVIFTLLRALKRGLADAGLVSEDRLNLKDLLDCLTIATLTDMVPLVEDNRLLVKHGLKVLENTRRPGLRALLKKLKLDGRELSAQDVAIRFAPKLNALSRLDTDLKPLDIFMAEDLEKAEALVDQVLSQNSERLDLQENGDRIAYEILSNWTHADFIVVTSKEFHRGVVGLIATKLANERGRPAFVGAEDEAGMVVGSARAPGGSGVSVLAALKSVEGLLERFGGHPPAAGFEFHMDRKEAIVAGLAEHHRNLDFSAEPVLSFDCLLRLADLSPGFLKWLEALGPFGVDFPVPTFCFENLVLEQVIALRGGHQKWILREMAGTEKLDALYFSPPPGLNVPKGSLISVLGEVQKNTYMGSSKPQILIRDYQFGSQAKKVSYESEVRRPPEWGA